MAERRDWKNVSNMYTIRSVLVNEVLSKCTCIAKKFRKRWAKMMNRGERAKVEREKYRYYRVTRLGSFDNNEKGTGSGARLNPKVFMVACKREEACELRD